MKRSPRVLGLSLAASLSLTTLSVLPAVAQDAPADATAAKATIDKGLIDSVDTFWHYGKIARYDLAAEEAKKILARNDDATTLLSAFEQVASARKDNLDQWLLRWQGVEAMRESTTQLIQAIGKGHTARREDPKYIEQNIRSMAVNDRARVIALARLRETGELAMPGLISYLRDPAKKEFHPYVRQAIAELGRNALNPLVAVTETKDNELLVQVIGALQDLGYEVGVPYLAKIASDQQISPPVREAAANALASMGAGRDLNPADQFYELAEKLYYDKSSIAADPRREAGYVWFWNDNIGLTRKDVPLPIFNEVMAMRAAEYSLKIGGSKSDALSLWLAANYKREAELPQGQNDGTRAEGQPSAHFYGVSSGTQYLNAVLGRAMKDNESPVALRAVKSLQEIVGQSNVLGSGETQPLLEAMGFPDRLVRYEAAFALASALPQKQFSGQEQVVPLLAEALSQSGTATALLLLPSQDDINSQTEALKGIGYNVVGGVNAESAIAAAATKPAIDLVVISEDVDRAQIDQILGSLGNSRRLQRVPRVIITKNPASPWVATAANDPLLTATQAKEAAQLKDVFEQARKKAGSLPLNEEDATKYALRAAEHLSKLAMSRGQVFDLAVAEGGVLASLEDSRPDVVKAVGNVAALFESKQAQVALASKALDEKTSDELKVSLFKSLALSAKFNGNHLERDTTDALLKLVSENKNNDVRSAAAEAAGALNLPSDQARKLVIEQSKT